MTEPVVDLPDVKARLNIPVGNTSSDDELMLYLQSASDVLVGLYGDIFPAVYTDTVHPYGDGSRIMLPRSPVLSVQSLAVGWYGSPQPFITLDPTRYRLDGGAGIIYAVGYGVYTGFECAGAPFGGTGYGLNVQVTYTAGRAAVTPAVQDAVLEILRVNWQPQRTAEVVANPLAEQDPDNGFTYLGYYIPNGAHERIAGGKRPKQMA